MARDVDPRRTRKAQRLVERLKRAAETSPDPLSNWEDQFLAEVDERLGKYGSSFRDLAKGAPDEAVSRLQAQKLKEIAAKASGKTKAQAEKRALKQAAKLEEKRAKAREGRQGALKRAKGRG
ncbi:MAG: hypothetical protein ABW199_03985 [Caulobacterales bacterium]